APWPVPPGFAAAPTAPTALFPEKRTFDAVTLPLLKMAPPFVLFPFATTMFRRVNCPLVLTKNTSTVLLPLIVMPWPVASLTVSFVIFNVAAREICPSQLNVPDPPPAKAARKLASSAEFTTPAPKDCRLLATPKKIHPKVQNTLQDFISLPKM